MNFLHRNILTNASFLTVAALLLSTANLPAADDEGYKSLFDGKTFEGWQVPGQKEVKGYTIEDGAIVCQPQGGGNLYTAKEYKDFALKFEFKLTKGANNGIGIRTPLQGDPAYVGMEIQVLDDGADQYKSLAPYQYHGSVYGVVACKKGHQKPVGEWNSEEIIVKGKTIKVILNGETIVDADLDKASTPKTIDGHDHPGLKRDSGYICFCGHGAHVEFRNLKIKELE